MKKGRSTYTFKINNNANQLNQLIQQFIAGNNFVAENKNGETYYKSGNSMIGYQYFNYAITGDSLIIYAWLKNFSTDVEIEQSGLTSANAYIINYRNLLGKLFAEIDKINNTPNISPVNQMNTGNVTGYNSNTGEPFVPNINNNQMGTNNAAGYNPNTGEPLVPNINNNQMGTNNAAGYNPNTGEPLVPNANSNQMNTGNITGYNPNTGEPIYGNKNDNSFSEQFQNANEKKRENLCEIGFWVSIIGLIGAFLGMTWGVIVYILIFYFASQGMNTRKKDKAVATIVINVISLIILIIKLLLY